MFRLSKTFTGFALAGLAVAAAQAQTPTGSWTGFYGGISGAAQGTTSNASGTNTYTTEVVVEPTGDPTGSETQHVLAGNAGTTTTVQTEAIADHRAKTIAGVGAHLGYNFQAGNLVFGPEADIQYADYTDGGTGLGGGIAGPNEGYSLRSHGTVVGTLRARAGVAFDRVLLFGTGGLALSDLRDTVTTNSGFTDSRRQTTGWTGGGGAEFRLAPHVSLVAMVLYTDFGTANLGAGDGTSSFATTIKTHYVNGSLGLSMVF